jgi:hypothetical protein
MVWRLRLIFARPLATTPALRRCPAPRPPHFGGLPDPLGARSYRARTARHLRNRAFLSPPSLPSERTGRDFQPSKGMTPHAGSRTQSLGYVARNTPRPAKVGQSHEWLTPSSRRSFWHPPPLHRLDGGTRVLMGVCHSIFFRNSKDLDVGRRFDPLWRYFDLFRDFDGQRGSKGGQRGSKRGQSEFVRIPEKN